ncbi:MAG: DNA-protecting protein DprA [Lachnospiraceae bacterium]|nr:DNA-protecting protein DprA [Lachnospiraceae bacterium]
MIKDKIRHYDIGDREYPIKLTQIANPPKRLYVLGRLPNPDQPSIAIVGARNATPYGRKTAWEFAKVLSDHGVQVISGFARGIDRAGHEGALSGESGTFAVLGNGVDICYPRENIDLYNKIIDNGGFLSEFPPETPPLARHFPSRNRIISGLADKILVVEAREKSGSLITADFGLEQGKDVYAVPGRICDAQSRGCNHLIMQGAGLASCAEMLLKDFQIDMQYLKRFREKNDLPLAQEEETVYSCIGLQPKHVEEILAESKLELPKLVSALLQLELNHLIQEVTKNHYIRV